MWIEELEIGALGFYYVILQYLCVIFGSRSVHVIKIVIVHGSCDLYDNLVTKTSYTPSYRLIHGVLCVCCMTCTIV